MVSWVVWILWITRNRDRPANALGAALALGLITFGIGGYWIASEKQPELRWVILPLMIPGAGLILYRLVRPLAGRAAIPTGACQFCKKPASVSVARYIQITGALIFFYVREVSGFACRPCSRSMFLRMTGHSLLLGWWELTALFVTPAALLYNCVFFLRSVAWPADSSYARSQVEKTLDEHRDYALNLLATKDEDTVVAVLARQAELTEDQVRYYVHRVLGKR